MLTQARLDICRERRFLAPALSRLDAVVTDQYIPAAVDGRRFFCHPNHVDRAVSLLFHGLCHCLLGHIFLRDASALACDVAVTLLAAEVAPELLPCAENNLLAQLRQRCMDTLDPRRLDVLLCEDDFLHRMRGDIAAMVALDDHAPWQLAREQTLLGGDGGLEKMWLAERRRLPAGFGGRNMGRQPGSHREKAVLGEGTRHEYARYLRRYAVEREYARNDPDSFQYAWYAYGMEHYGNVPLIEPLEYRIERRLEELVIVIDTSGSCARGLTQQFLEQTRDIILKENLFFHRFNLHILQCDAKVQRDDKITGIPEFESYIDTLEIVGGGGTDFCPAFAHIDGLIRSGELRRLKGILYFTDGRGIYPSKPPQYEATFVFLQHRYDDIDTPRWARRLVLDAPMPRGNEYMEY